MTLTIVLVASDPGHRSEFATAAAEASELEVVEVCDAASPAARATERHRPDVVVVDRDLRPDAAESVVRSLVAHDPALAVVLWAGAEGEAATAAAALEAGCRAVLPRPLAIEDAVTRLRAAASWSARVRSRRTGGGEAPPGEAVAVFGAKGGVGTSSLAVQLARLAAEDGTGTVLVDLDLGGPDLTALLDVAHHRTVLDLVPVAHHLDERYLTDALHPHRTGIRLLPGVPEGERADELDDEVTRRIMTALRAHAPATVVDCGSRLDEATAVALELADHALLVVTPDVPCLLAARRHLAALERLSVRSADRFLVVVNRHTRGAELQPAVVARALGVEVAAAVPTRTAFTTAAAEARPELLDDRPSRRALTRVARSVDLVPDRAPRTWSPPHRRARGQASIELLGVVPLLVLIALLALQGLVTTSAAASAQDAARAAARAAATGADPTAAATADLPDWLAHQVDEVRVERRGGRVHVEVRLRPPGPGSWVGGGTVTGEATFADEER